MTDIQMLYYLVVGIYCAIGFLYWILSTFKELYIGDFLLILLTTLCIITMWPACIVLGSVVIVGRPAIKLLSIRIR